MVMVKNDRKVLKEKRFWNQLLGTTARGRVVPVVGEDILVLPDGSGELLYDGLAKRYASFCDLPLSGQAPILSSFIRSHPDFRDNPHDVYQEIGEEYMDWSPDIPESLINLAEIRHFTLFISTTFDDLLERAINQVRFNGQKQTVVVTYSPKHIPSDREIAQALSSGMPVVFQMFGSYKNPLRFALTDGDRVEYMHALQSVEYSPKRMFDEFCERPLLFLGNNFPDWFSRLFLRMTRKIPLDHRDVPKQYFADTIATKDPELNFFLRHFTTNTEIVGNLHPMDFIKDFAKKWQERYGGQANSDIEQAPIDIPDSPMPKDAVFISYCATDINGEVSGDSRLAMVIKTTLEAAGINVWLDKAQLQGGDEYKRKIRRYIKTCSLFMPLISESTESRQEAFFRLEWSWALERLPAFTGSDRQFLFPVVIDDIDPYNAIIPEEFKRFQFTRITDSTLNQDFIETVRSLYDKALGHSGRIGDI